MAAAQIEKGMASLAESVNFEESRQQENVIRLIKSGEFYRAYNRSAWLFHSAIADHKVIRKYVKSLKKDIYYIGFPDKSLFGNIGDRESVKTDFGFDVYLKTEEMPEELTFDDWATTIACEPAATFEYNSLPLVGIDAEKEVLRRLRSYPIEAKTMVECVVFLSELRAMLNQK